MRGIWSKNKMVFYIKCFIGKVRWVSETDLEETCLCDGDSGSHNNKM